MQTPAQCYRFLASLAAAAVLVLSAAPQPVRADALDDLEAQIQRYQVQLAQISADTISVDNQIADTADRISRLQRVLQELNGQLLNTNASLARNEAALRDLQRREALLADELARTEARLANRERAFESQVRVLDKAEDRNPLTVLITSQSFGQMIRRMTELRQVSEGTHLLAVQLRADRDSLAMQRVALVEARREQARTVAMIQEQKQALEQEYGLQASATAQLERLRAQLGVRERQLVEQASGISAQIATNEAQIESLLAFSRGQGGDMVPPEYLANSWGDYYNQRDARWGNQHLGRSPYRVWEIGCLLTSVAMVHSHFGNRSVTPGVIAAGAANFTPDGLLYNSALDVPGHSPTINSNPSREWINGYLQAGGTVIVGMNIGTGGTHFVVLVAQNGPYDYWINDPWVANAMHVSFAGSPVTGPIYAAIGYR